MKWLIGIAIIAVIAGYLLATGKVTTNTKYHTTACATGTIPVGDSCVRQ